MEYSQHPRNVNTKTGIPVQTSTDASFQYIGRTALTIIGNVTGTRYRFNYPGSKQNIDDRDVPGIITVPVLKKVR